MSACSIVTNILLNFDTSVLGSLISCIFSLTCNYFAKQVGRWKICSAPHIIAFTNKNAFDSNNKCPYIVIINSNKTNLNNLGCRKTPLSCINSYNDNWSVLMLSLIATNFWLSFILYLSMQSYQLINLIIQCLLQKKS